MKIVETHWLKATKNTQKKMFGLFSLLRQRKTPFQWIHGNILVREKETRKGFL